MESPHEKGGMTNEEATAFIGDNPFFYLQKWKLHANTALKGWNWAAMFFGIDWMVYRKMYLEAMLSYVIIFGISFTTIYLYDFSISYWLIRILFGILGNALYWKKALRELRKIDIQNDSDRLEELSRRGGVSWTSVIVVFFLEFAVKIFIIIWL